MSNPYWTENHRMIHLNYKKISDGEKLFYNKRLISKEWLEKLHKYTVKRIFDNKHKHMLEDHLDRTLPLKFQEMSEQKTVLLEDLFFETKNKLMDALTTTSGDSLIPKKIDKEKVKWAFYLSPPEGQRIWELKKKMIVKTAEYKQHIEELLLLVSGDFAYNIIKLLKPLKINQKEFKALEHEHLITPDEAKKYGFDKKDVLFAYKFTIEYSYPKPVKIVKPRGLQNFTELKNIKVPKEEKKLEEIVYISGPVVKERRDLDKLFFEVKDLLTVSFGF